MLDDTVFRFITVRGPRKPTTKEVDTWFVRYDAPINSAVIGAYLAKTTAEAVAFAQRFKETAEFAAGLDDLERRQNGLVTAGEWLQAEAKTLTAAQFTHFLEAARMAPQPGIPAWLWDNLAAHALVGGRPEVREAIINALRFYRLLVLPDPAARSDVELRRMAVATVLLPARTAAPVKPGGNDGGGSVPAEPGETAAARTARGMEQIAIVRRAAEALANGSRQEIERLRGLPAPPLGTPPVADEDGGGAAQARERTAAAGVAWQEAMLVSRERIEGLDRQAQDILREAGVEAGARLAYARERLRLHAQAIAEKTMSGLTAEQRVVRAGGAFWAAASKDADNHVNPALPGRQEEFYAGFFATERPCKIHPLGIADYRRVEQRLFCYEAGEVAHIENVMQGEEKERTTRNLRRTEDTLTLSTQEESTRERDTQTSDRFEITKEAGKVVVDDSKSEVGVKVQGGYGPVSITADTQFATSSSTTESDKQATRYGRDVTERALERIVKTVREERVSKVVAEHEEINKHGLKGAEDSHLVGLYRWVDKIYEARVVNYGKRLMFEFMVPEPAAFHLYASAHQPVESSLDLRKPIDPRSPELLDKTGLAPLTSHAAINEWNFAAYAAAYEARPETPPALWLTTSKACHSEDLDQTSQFADSINDLKVPDGYEAQAFFMPFAFHQAAAMWLSVYVGAKTMFSTQAGTFASVLDGEDDLVPMVIMGRTRFYALNIEILCQRSVQLYETWQIKVFNAIIDAYNAKLAAYNNALAAAKTRGGIEISGGNPVANRQREQAELQKSCIRLLSQRCEPFWSNAMKDNKECHYPEFDCCEAIRDGSYVQFVEQCFDWKLMTYLFLPYLWGRKCNWQKIYQLEDTDSLFLAFLQAGFARVLVPVRPGYEPAALRFLADGTIWNGGAIPGVDDPLYQSIVVEMMEEAGAVDPDIQPWRIKVPTTLTVLQCEAGCTPGAGLPCPGAGAPWPVPG